MLNDNNITDIRGSISNNTDSNAHTAEIICENNVNTYQYLHYRDDREIYGLQILKFLCALLVVQIHFFSSIQALLLPLTRVAVPIFFMITGYFLLDKFGNLHIDRIKRMGKKILKIEIIACSVYTLYYILLSIRHNENFLLNLLDFGYLIDMIALGNVPEGHLWYLIALLQALFIIYLASRLKILNWLYWIIPIGLTMNLIFGRYNFIVSELNIPNNLVLSRNVITIALPCILIGMILRNYEHRLPINKKIVIASIIGIFGIYVEELILTNIKGDIILFTIPCAITIFLVFLRIPVNSKWGFRLANYGKAYSLDIYIWHLIIGSIVMAILAKMNLSGLGAFIVIIITFYTAIFLKHIGLKKLYS